MRRNHASPIKSELNFGLIDGRQAQPVNAFLTEKFAAACEASNSKANSFGLIATGDSGRAPAQARVAIGDLWACSAAVVCYRSRGSWEKTWFSLPVGLSGGKQSVQRAPNGRRARVAIEPVGRYSRLQALLSVHQADLFVWQVPTSNRELLINRCD